MPASSLTNRLLVNVPRLVTAYFTGKPDPSVAAQRVAFGTSGHRGSAFNNAFNEAHILAISQAICDHRQPKRDRRPLFIGIDTHALSEPALASALEVFAANGVEVMIDEHDGYTPTPVISHAILTYNKGRTERPGRRRRDHAVAQSAGRWRLQIQPAQRRPGRYRRSHGGSSAPPTACSKASSRASSACRTSGRAKRPACIATIISAPMSPISPTSSTWRRSARPASKIGIDPLGGAGVHYWQPIIERYGIDATVVSDAVDPTFRFMTVDWDGKIRMDCSSPYAMARLIGMRDQFDVAFANDTDADRHGIVTRSNGLMNPEPLSRGRDRLSVRATARNGATTSAVGKTIVSSAIIDRVASEARPQAGRSAGRLQMVRRWPGRRLASASPARRAPAHRSCGATDRSGPPTRTASSSGLLAAEITARTGRDPSQFFDQADRRTRRAVLRADRRAGDAAAEEPAEGADRRSSLAMKELAGEPVRAVADRGARQRCSRSAASR